jgi:hypothetical protein
MRASSVSRSPSRRYHRATVSSSTRSRGGRFRPWVGVASAVVFLAAQCVAMGHVHAAAGGAPPWAKAPTRAVCGPAARQSEDGRRGDNGPTKSHCPLCRILALTCHPSISPPILIAPQTVTLRTVPCRTRLPRARTPREQLPRGPPSDLGC